MKTHKLSTRQSRHGSLAACIATVSVLIFGAGNALATTTTYSYNPSAVTNSPWSGASWSTTGASPYSSSWVNGTTLAPSIANFSFAADRTITLSSETIVFGAGGGLTKQSGGVLTISGGNGTYSTMDFSGATISNAESANNRNINFTGNINVNLSGATIAASTSTARAVRFLDNVVLTGNFTATGATVLSMNTAYVGTATIQGLFNPSEFDTSTSTASNFIINGTPTTGILAMTHTSGTRTLGSVQVNSGSLRLGSTSTASGTTIVTELSGTGGEVRANNPNASTNGQLNSLVVNQATNSTNNSWIRGASVASTNTTYMSLTKQGTGNLTLTGEITQLQNVRVEGGGLFIAENSAATRSFANLTGGNGSAALTIANGGTFGGNFSGTRKLDIIGNRNIVVESGGRLSPGLVDGSGNATIGLLRISFPDGGSVDLTEAVGNTGWLRFDLGANTAAGTTYDQINLTSGTLLIGTSLKFSDFNFTTNHGGFDQGVYTLFSLTGSSALSGSLNTDQNLLSGIVGTSGLTGTLGLSGNDIILTVIPKPRASLLLLGAVVLWFVTRRRRMPC
jgi:hypothetical protein